MKVLIIEDEAPAARRLTGILEKHEDVQAILATLDTVEDTINWLNEYEGEPGEKLLIFSDIQLADGTSFEIFQEVDVKWPVIFTTAYNEYALKAFEVNSVDYLLKPYSDDQVHRSIRKYKELYEADEIKGGANVGEIYKALQMNPQSYKQRFLVHRGNSLLPVSVSDIAYFYTEDKVVFLRTHSNERFYLNHSLEDLDHMLDPTHFFRLNRQFIVSFDSIKKIESHFNGKLKVTILPACDSDVMVSRAKAHSFREWLER